MFQPERVFSTHIITFGFFEVMTCVQLKIDEPFQPDGFREEMEKCVYR